MTQALTYEYFVRNAIALKESKSIERYGDPASLADTDNFTEHNINSVKAAVSYSMEAYNTHIINNDGGTIIDDNEQNRISNFTPKVFTANSIAEISELIDTFKTEVIDKHFPK